MALLWMTPAGNLGTIPDLEFYELPLEVRNSNDPYRIPEAGEITFKHIAGTLPPGLAVLNDGTLGGVPVLGEIEGVTADVSKVTTNTFTIRATDGKQIADRTFSITVAGVDAVSIIPEEPWEFFDGDLVLIQLLALEYTPDQTEVWRLSGGTLPPGLSINSTGIISGYIRTTASQFVDTLKLDYTFTVTVSDGSTSDNQTFTITVYQRTEITADSTNNGLLADSVTVVNASTDSKHSPLLMNFNTTLDPIRQGGYYAYQFIGIDLDGDVVGYRLTAGSTLPPGLELDPSTGWLHGFVPYGSLGIDDFTFGVVAYKMNDPIVYATPARLFTVTMLGRVDNTVVWNTASSLGVIDNGAISNFSVSAYTNSNRVLFYRLSGTNNELPVGLSLLPDGNIVGKVNFQVFKFDNDTTTFDNNTTTFDRQFEFTVEAYDNEGFATGFRSFNITVKNYNENPYYNLYLKALLPRPQRLIYSQVINNSDVFPAEDIYRASDPEFGKNVLVRCLFQTGLTGATAATYVQAMEKNHYWKKINFGEVKTAWALDRNLNIKYEVVYVELVDDQQNQGVGPNLEVKLKNNRSGFTEVYPNSFENMSKRIIAGVGAENLGVLPEWMTSRQENGKVLGFTRAFVLCYTKPGKSKAMAYRLTQLLGDLRLVDFTVDRYELEFTHPLWAAGTEYEINDLVLLGPNAYICKIAHTSSNFDTDLAAGRWRLYINGTSVQLNPWAIHGLYEVGDYIINEGVVYICIKAHRAGSTFVADFNTGVWTVFTNSYDFQYLKFPQTNLLENVCY